MKLNRIKINSYGNLQNKEIEFNKLNIIFGENEAGKTTLQNFIMSMFYGIEKKKGKEAFSDIEKYTPWQGTTDFSGKISYELDDNTKYEVFRDFTKKNPEIYDETGKDITKDFSIDKKVGNTFFMNQVGLDRNTLEKTVFTKQNSLKIDSSEQDLLIQKVSNMVESGDEEVSFKKALKSLGDRKLKEVGTDRSQEKPINIASMNIRKYEQELSDIENARDSKEEIEFDIQRIEKDIDKSINNSTLYAKIKEIVDNDRQEEEKIKAKEEIIKENEEKINKIQNDIDNLDKKKKNKIYIILLILSILISILGIIFVKSNLKYLTLILIPIVICLNLINRKKNSSANLSSELKVLNENNNKLKEDTEIQRSNLLKVNEIQKQDLIKAYGSEIEDLFGSNIELAISNNIKKINELELEKHKRELDYKDIEPKMERLAHVEELLDLEKENFETLKERQEDFDIAKDLLTQSYEEMKKNITPKFNDSFNYLVNIFTNGKYSRVIFNDGIYVEVSNGQMISLEGLSFGTIQEIYLALRLAMIKELSKENIPIILDEPFAYFDDNRIAKVIESLNQLDNQVIIFTCTNRENEIINKLGLEYNFIKL